MRDGSVCCVCSHDCSCVMRDVLKEEASGHVSIWVLSSLGIPHKGQLESRRCFLWYMVLPLAISEAMNLEMNLTMPNRDDERLTL